MISIILLLLNLLQVATAVYSKDGHNVVSYWGQSPYQQRLSYYCKLKNMDMVLLSFVRPYNEEVTFSFGNACYGDSCPDIAEDIKVCQDLGIKVLLSLGGTYSKEVHYSVPQPDASIIADKLYNMFGPHGNVFPGATIDGFDFDMEGGDNTGYVSLMKEIKSKFGSDHIISATPQCPFPDKQLGDSLNASPDIDIALIQFYNNPSCMAPAINNWSTWKDALENKFANKNMKLYFGVPGSSKAAGTGYVNIKTLKSKTKNIIKDPSFGGFMVWDVAFSYNNSNFLSQVKLYLNTVKTTKITTTASGNTTSFTTTTSFYSSSTTLPEGYNSTAVHFSLDTTYNIIPQYWTSTSNVAGTITVATKTADETTFATGTGDGTTFATGTGDGAINTIPVINQLAYNLLLPTIINHVPTYIRNVSFELLNNNQKRDISASSTFSFTVHKTLQTSIIY